MMKNGTKQTNISVINHEFNRLTPNDPYMSRTAPLTFKRFILYIYSTNIGTEYFKHALCYPFFLSSKCSLFHNANLFASCIIHILYTGCVKIKKNNSGAKGLICGLLEIDYRYSLSTVRLFKTFPSWKAYSCDLILTASCG